MIKVGCCGCSQSTSIRLLRLTPPHGWRAATTLPPGMSGELAGLLLLTPKDGGWCPACLAMFYLNAIASMALDQDPLGPREEKCE